MANKKISQLTEVTNPNATDVIPVVNASETKKTQLGNLPISDATQSALDGKQDTLVSGTNIKTINSESLLGSGNIAIDLSPISVDGDKVSIAADTTATTQTTAVIQATDTDSGIAIVPNGTGAFTLDVPDGTATGGNARGNNAVDLQMYRTGPTDVAGGNYSVIVGGRQNEANGDDSVAIGFNNRCNSNNSYALGTSNNSSGVESVSIGIGCTASGYSSISMGRESSASSNRSIAIGNNCVSSADRSVAIGLTNTASSGRSVVSGGESNTSSTNTHATVVGGYQNSSTGQYSISGGYSNVASGLGSVALGYDNTASQSGSVALGRESVANLTNAVAIGYQVTSLYADGTTVKNFAISNYASLNFADDSAAATGGVPIGGVYHTSGALKIRLT